MPIVLNVIGNILDESDLSMFSMVFFLEQLRIERYYLGHQHHDLAPTLNRIGEIYLKHHQLSEAEECFAEVILILKSNNTKGSLYSLAMYNVGLVKYYSSLYVDALELFKKAIKEQRSAMGGFHPNLAEMCVKIGDFQFELGKLTDAMERYLEALMIMRNAYGNTHCKVSQILYKIGLIHQEQNEFVQALNAFCQALNILKNDQDGEDTLIITISYQMGLIQQYLGNFSKTITIFQDIIKILKSKLGERHKCVASALGLLRNVYIECGMVENSKTVSEEIKDILKDTSNQSSYNENNGFADSVHKIFGYAFEISSQAAAAA